MCGIAGYLSTNTYPPEVLEDMVEAVRHRGPDAAGFYHDGFYHAGMRRLSINDVAGGDQPLYNRDKTVALLYNGEIYNSPVLRRELEKRGILFRTHSDGEVICHLYEFEGERLFERLDGMFAAALWDVQRRRLILARDIPGEKPLYYSHNHAGELAFASEIGSLVNFPAVAKKLNRQALWDFPTFLWIPEPATVYENVFALPPGHLLIADETGVRLQSYVNRFVSTQHDYSDEEATDETRRLVQEAVRSRLLSDVPIGCFLSSGLDSSLVTTLAARDRTDLSTFTIGFEDVADPYHGRADESPFSEAYARALGTRHHTVRVTADDFRRNLDRFTEHAGQPFAVSSGLGILSVAQAAREHGVKVLLSGDGADEIFGGYSWYEYLNQVNGQMPAPTVSYGEIISMQYVGLPRPRVLNALRTYPPAVRAWAWHYYASERDKAALFSPEIATEAKNSLRHFHEFQNGSPWSAEDTIRQDRLFYFPNEMLQKVDRMTMAFGVEGRVPFAAPALLSFADALRYPQMVRDGTLKWTLRQAFRDILPPAVTNRPKHGFNVPIDHWLKGRWSDLVRETFAPSSPLSRLGLIRSDAEQHARSMLADHRRLTGHTIFCCLQLNRWIERTEGVFV
ncbi:asparagine synthase (glutamine-hydrolyzing) [bacterium]|nr:asparagine synthase (glutamine-hydrolyzing) [bacterium]